ncbi:MAG: hypothetical protein JW910_06060 [Anaerolineae bacterium]|nr:hypothetical protein [Anaerolineae bacterium]
MSQRDPFADPDPATDNDPAPPAPAASDAAAAQDQDTAGTSPTRPDAPTSEEAPRRRLMPSKPDTAQLTPPEDVPSPAAAPGEPADPQAALERLRKRMTVIAQEFAAGKLNRAQFHAMYNRYSEQRNIIERLLARNPQSQAWQQVARPGHTSFLREHFASRLLYYALYVLGQEDAMLRYGEGTLPPEVQAIVRVLPGFISDRGPLAPARKRVRDGRWLVVVPGVFTVSFGIYSLEPATQQMRRLADLHGDFERANVHTLRRKDYAIERLVFPQRALFEV